MGKTHHLGGSHLLAFKGDDERYTPVTIDVLRVLYLARRDLGSWRRVAARAETKLRVIRRIRLGERKAVSLTMMDRLISKLGYGDLNDYVWFTPDDLVALGIWYPIEGPPGRKPQRKKKRY